MNNISILVVASGLALITASAQNAPTVINPSSASAPNGIAPNGIGATANQLLFSQPYCQTASQDRGIYSVTNLTGSASTRSGTVSETTPLLEAGNTTQNCAENYFIISTGSGSFTAGAVYSTGWNATGSAAAVFKNGALLIDNIPGSFGHAGITFDTIGTFQSALIVTTTSAVLGFDSSAHQLFSYPTPSGYLFESSTVAPISNVSCPGCLYLTAESLQAAQGQTSPPPGAVYVIHPGTPSGTPPTLLATTPGVEPENILYVGPQVCTLNGTDFAYFVSAYASDTQRFTSPSTSGAVLAFTAVQLAPYTGQFLIPFEDGTIYAFNGTSGLTPYSTNLTNYQLEGASLVQCPAATGCPATQGLWETHDFPASMFNSKDQMVIGGIAYTAEQLHLILKTAPQGGKAALILMHPILERAPQRGNAALILMHQLIAALANEAAGAQNTGVTELGVNVNLVIAEAEALLQFGLPQPGFPGSNPAGVTFPIDFNASAGNFVQPTTTLGGYFNFLANVLEAYNSAIGLGCKEGIGLTTGTKTKAKANNGHATEGVQPQN